MGLLKVSPLKHLNKLVENESLEPLLGWGFRMAVAAIVPVIWGLATGNMQQASWIALTAECICWMELKGGIAQRVRVLTIATILALASGAIGSVTGNSVLISVVVMLFVGILAGLFKNLGERGNGLALCVSVLFIISNAYPTHVISDLNERLLLILIGGCWTFLVSMVFSGFMPVGQPYRRSVALIWRANAQLMAIISKGWDGASVRSNIRNIYGKETEVRTAINSSLHFYGTLADQVNKTEKEKYQLAQLRKTTALVATNLISISEEIERIKIREATPELRIKLNDTFKVMEQTLDRMAVFVVSLKAEEELLINSRLTRLKQTIAILKGHKAGDTQISSDILNRIVQLVERVIRLIEASLSRLENLGSDLPAFRSYSLVKTLLVLHPKHWLRNIRLLFNLQTNNTRYALRSALAACIGLFVYKRLQLSYGFWIPFTSLMVVQPYFTATFKKAIDRVLGTVTGGVFGWILILLPAGVYAKEIMLFFSFLFMVYFTRKRYPVAVFFITLSVVLLFDVEEEIDAKLIMVRALFTVMGAGLGIAAGFLLFPYWDRKWLPVFLSDAIQSNYQYFIATFYSKEENNWVKHKRNAETKNSNAFDSFSRYLNEPVGGKRQFLAYYQLLHHSVRITRELNNINLELEHLEEAGNSGIDDAISKIDEGEELIVQCLYWFNENVKSLKKLHPDVRIRIDETVLNTDMVNRLTIHQKVYLNKLLAELKIFHEDINHLKG